MDNHGSPLATMAQQRSVTQPRFAEQDASPAAQARERRRTPIFIRRLRLLRALAFFAMLQSVVGPWPFFAQYGQTHVVSRPEYYLTFLTTLFILGVFALHLFHIKTYFLKNLDLFLFCLFAIYRESLTGQIGLVMLAAGYLKVFGLCAVLFLVDGPRYALKLLVSFLLYCLGANILSFVVPSISVMSGDLLSGFFRGLTPHRNILAMIVNLAMAVLFVAPIGKGIKTAALAIGALLLILAGSASGFIFALLSFAIFALYSINRSLPGARIVGLALAFAAVSAFLILGTASALDDALGLFGRDASFSGRDNIWALAYYMIERVPPLGYGMEQFNFQALNPELLETFRLGTSFASAHSAYLEAVIDFGWLGAALFFLGVARHTGLVVSSIFTFHDRTRLAPLIVFLTASCVLGGLVEAERLFLPTVGWLTFVVAKSFYDTKAAWTVARV